MKGSKQELETFLNESLATKVVNRPTSKDIVEGLETFIVDLGFNKDFIHRNIVAESVRNVYIIYFKVPKNGNIIPLMEVTGRKKKHGKVNRVTQYIWEDFSVILYKEDLKEVFNQIVARYKNYVI